jgi:diguanylate cyclase (GGDEF)-like protein
MPPEGEGLQNLAMELGNQELKEIIEIASQITAQLDIDNIIKNVVLSLYAKFQAPTVTLLRPHDLDENRPVIHHFRGMAAEGLELEIPSITAILGFLERDEYNQISFGYFSDNFPDPGVVNQLATVKPDIIVPLRTDKGVNGLILLPAKAGGGPYTLLDVQYITQIVRFASIALENANLYWQATTDRMTKLFSHHFFEKNLEEEILRARRYGAVFSLLMLDIDHFKKFNDTYGHLQGDLIIKEIAHLLRSSVRSIDFTARYGGEEFAIILPEVNIQGAAVVAGRIRQSIEKHSFAGEEGPLHVTISIGAAEFKADRMRTASQFIAEADKALYQSKEAGRNRVTVQK